MKIPSNSLYELVSNKSITDQGARPILHQIVLEAVPLEGVRMAPIQFECPVPGSMMRNGRWGGERERGEGIADAGVHLQYLPQQFCDHIYPILKVIYYIVLRNMPIYLSISRFTCVECLD